MRNEKEYYKKNKVRIIARIKKYQEKNKEKIKKYRLEHPEQKKKNARIYYLKNQEKIKEYGRKYKKKYYKENKGRISKSYKIYSQTSKGKEIKKRGKAKRRQFGFFPLNKYFKGSNAHHIDMERVIYMPEELHRSIPHSVLQNINIEKINEVAFDFLNKQV